jgi:hypothetical protein
MLVFDSVEKLFIYFVVHGRVLEIGAYRIQLKKKLITIAMGECHASDGHKQNSF